MTIFKFLFTLMKKRKDKLKKKKNIYSPIYEISLGTISMNVLDNKKSLKIPKG